MWNDITARHLLALQAVHEEGTFGRAAERLGFTQSAVSQQIASFEQIVGQPLFDRKPGPNPPTLTPCGVVALRHAESLLKSLRSAETELDRLIRGESGSIRVGTFQSISARILPLALSRIYQAAPDVEITLVADDGKLDIINAIETGDLDIAFTVDDPPAGIASTFMTADPYVAVVPADEPPGPIKLKSLADRALIGQPEEDTCTYPVVAELHRLGVNPTYAFRSHDNGAVQAMVAAGMGVAIAPLLTVDSADPRTEVRTTTPAIRPRRISIIWNDHRTLAPVAQQLIDELVDVCAHQLTTELSLSS